MTAEKERVIFRHGRDRDFTEDEYFALLDEGERAKDRGDMKEYERIRALMPANPEVMKAFKEVYGKEFVLSCGLDLTEANLKFGKGWLDEPDEQ